MSSKTPAPNPATLVRITDTSLRDAHQSLWATRMRTSDILDILDVVDNVGFYSLECWGGATFDVCLRFLRENPWERLRLIKARAKKTPLQMLLRGQNLLGYRHYPDDVLDRFIALSVENGMDIFRVFDALNDNRNLEAAIRAVKKYGGHPQGTICYTTSPVHTTELFVQIAREQEQMGAESLCIKDMAGILTPVAAQTLVSALSKAISIPIQVHTHATSGMGATTYFEAVKAGAGAIDTAVWSMAGFSSQPPVETMLAMLSEAGFDAGLDLDALRRVGRYFADLRRAREPATTSRNYVDPGILEHKVPGGMISNLRSQLQQQNALDRLDEVLAEIPRTRADMGYPPLVTPTSQIVGVQSVLNVLSGERYKIVPQETKDYVKGLYGRSPAPIDPAVRKAILGKEKPIAVRPADLLPPMLPTAADNVNPKLLRGEEDILSFCLFPEPALAYFTWRNLPPDVRPPIPADEEEKARDAAKATAAPAAPAKPLMAKEDYAELQGLLGTVTKLGISELVIRRPGATVELRAGAAAPARSPESEVQSPKSEVSAPDSSSDRSIKSSDTQSQTSDSGLRTSDSGLRTSDSGLRTSPAAPAAGDTLVAPLTGAFYRSSGLNQPNLVEEGANLKVGQTYCIIEAMKLFNQIQCERACRLVKFLVKHGETVQKGQPIAAVEYK